MYIFRKLLHGILAEKTPIITTQSEKELAEEILLVKDAMEFEEISDENPEENPEDEAAEDGEGEEEEE